MNTGVFPIPSAFPSPMFLVAAKLVADCEEHARFLKNFSEEGQLTKKERWIIEYRGNYLSYLP